MDAYLAAVAIRAGLPFATLMPTSTNSKPLGLIYFSSPLDPARGSHHGRNYISA